MTTPKPIQRYELENVTTMGQHDRQMAKDSWGTYVLHSDHLAAMAAATPRWIPCAERMPPLGELVWAWIRSRTFGEHTYKPFMCLATRLRCAGASDESWWEMQWPDSDGSASQSDVTHWMPLPQPPKETM